MVDLCMLWINNENVNAALKNCIIQTTYIKVSYLFVFLDFPPYLITMETSIVSAILKGYFQQVRFLVETGCDVNERDALRRTPLMTCALVGDESWSVGLARVLIEHGASGSIRDKHGLNAFHHACIYQRLPLAKVRNK